MPDAIQHLELHPDGSMTLRDAAAALGLTYEALRKAVGQGAPVAFKGGRGAQGGTRLRLTELLEWQVERRVRQAIGEAGGLGQGEVHDFEAERARKTKFQADMAEIEARKAAGEIVEVDAVADVIEMELAEVRAGLLNLAGRLAVPLSGITDPADIADRISDEVAAVLQLLSEPSEIARLAATGEDRFAQDEDEAVGD
jgi:phage terminase Nu1 subunit (DNA packaging protein)